MSAMDRGISAAGILGGGYAKTAGKGGKATLNLFSNGKNATNATEAAAKSSKNAASAKGDIPKGNSKIETPNSNLSQNFGRSCSKQTLCK
ncbi:hypothetical protein [Lysinibacillus sp. NPDC056185]|uniref:hypothetical protein n=1 Tax=Lysinibacillus sp. NPDC056185 TaxID=3345739 RepID=UPI0039EE5157